MGGITQQPERVALPTQLRSCLNGYIAPEYGLGKRPGSQYVGKFSVADETVWHFVHMVERSNSEKYAIVYDGTTLKVVDLATGNTHTVTVTDSPNTYFSGASMRTDVRALTLGDTTYLLNTQKTTAMTGSTSPTLTNEALVWCRQFNANYITYRVIIRYSGTTYDSTETAVAANENAEDLMTRLQTNLNAAFGGSAASWTLTVKQGVLSIKRGDNASFEIEATDNLTGRTLTVVKNSCQSFADLPPIAPNGYKAKVVGDLSVDQDDYWVTFVSNNTNETLSTGRWEETIAPSTAYQIDAATMPYIVVRTSSTTFTVKKATWVDKASGDSTIGRQPSFIGRTISAMFLFNDRLGFLSGNSMIMSVAGDYNNFWRQTALTVSDDDPIDVYPSNPKVTSLYHAVPFDQSLLIFGNQSQFILQAGAQLTPRTVSLPLASSYDSSRDCVPISFGNSALFIQPNSPLSGSVNCSLLMSYRVAEGGSGAKFADNLFAQCPTIMDRVAVQLASCPARGIVTISEGPFSTSQLWVHQSIEVGGERLVSSPHVWKMVSGTRFYGTSFIGTDLYLILRRPNVTGALVIERIDTSNLAPFPLLDQRIPAASCTVSYNGGTNQSTVTLPTGVTVDAANHQLVYEYGGLATIISTTSTQLVVSGDVRGTLFNVGLKYTFTAQVNDFFVRRPSANGSTVVEDSGRLQVSRASLAYTRTGYLKATVVIDTMGDTFTYEVDGYSALTPLNTYIAGSAGTLQIPIAALNSGYTFTISSDKPYDCWVVSAQWQGIFNPKGRPI